MILASPIFASKERLPPLISRSKKTGYLSDAGPQLKSFFRKQGVLLRPLGNVIYLMPPYCVTPLDLDLVYDAIHAAADMIETAAR